MAGTGANPAVNMQTESIGTHLPVIPDDATPEQVAYHRWLAMLHAAHNMGLHGTADVMGSPVAGGKLGNGPGTGRYGAGTQDNWGGDGVPV